MTAIDINPVLLELIPAQNLTKRQMDVRTSSGELPANAYDLVSCRALRRWVGQTKLIRKVRRAFNQALNAEHN